MIQLTLPDLTQLCRFNLAHFSWFKSSFLIWLNLLIHFVSSFMIQFDSIFQFYSTTTTSIQLTIFDSTHMFFSNLTRHLWFNSTHNSWLNLTQLSNYIQHTLHTFEPYFLIQNSYSDSILFMVSDSIWLSIYNSILLSFLIWLNYDYKHSTHNFRLNWYFLFQFD